MGKKFQFGKMKKFWKWVAQQCKYNLIVLRTLPNWTPINSKDAKLYVHFITIKIKKNIFKMPYNPVNDI